MNVIPNGTKLISALNKIIDTINTSNLKKCQQKSFLKYLLFDFQTIFTKWTSTIKMMEQMMKAAKQLFGIKKK